MTDPITPSDLASDLAELHALRALAADRDALRAKLAEALAVLIVIERNALSCPICCMHFRSGHSPDCYLAAALGKGPTTPTGQEKL